MQNQDAVLVQLEYIQKIKNLLHNTPKKAFTDTYGCQQNVADTEKITGMLIDMGFVIIDNEDDADIIVINTCAIRENAETKTLSRIGELSHKKRKNPNLIIGIFGCMVQQQHISDKLKKTFPFVDMVFGTHAMNKFPELLYRRITEDSRIFDLLMDGEIGEGLPVKRDGGVRAWLSIMYGCDNFCTYCIVPYVRGRERSRNPQDIIAELKELIAQGYKEITLLGQNVNSYGKGLNLDFSDLLELLNNVPGNFYLRFMTSVPQDANFKLIDTMAKCEKVAHQLHLPFQSGSDKILKAMNRKYTHQGYVELINYAKEKMPDITLSSDIIVGFPNETDDDFEKTLDLVRKIRFNSIYTYLYSKRGGTPAAKMTDIFSNEHKQKNFERLLDVQNEISDQKNKEYEGKIIKVIIDGNSKNPDYKYSSHSIGGLLVLVDANGLSEGDIVDVLCKKGTMRSILAEKV